VREHLGGALVGLHHADRTIDRALVELVTSLEQAHQLLEQPRHPFGVDAADRDLVAAHAHRGAGEVAFDAAQVLVARAEQRGHEVRAGNDDGRRVGRCHGRAVMRSFGHVGPIRTR
jgi:hypothetical protein